MGKRSSAGKTPPSKGVPSGPWMRHSQCSRSSSLTGPAVMPSGGLLVSARYSWSRRRCAVDWAMAGGGRRARGCARGGDGDDGGGGRPCRAAGRRATSTSPAPMHHIALRVPVLSDGGPMQPAGRHGSVPPGPEHVPGGGSLIQTRHVSAQGLALPTYIYGPPRTSMPRTTTPKVRRDLGTFNCPLASAPGASLSL